jgi:hypothetical protein
MAFPSPSLKRKIAISIETKKKILQELESGTRQCDIMRKYSLSSSTVAMIKKNKAKIEQTEFEPSRKRLHVGCSASEKGQELEAVFTWFKQTRSRGVPVSGPCLLTQAQELATELGFENFNPSTGWLDRFKKRKGITCKAISRESASVSTETTDAWKTKNIPELMQKYDLSQIYNAD